MSVLETFGLLFDTNANKAAKDVKGLDSELNNYDRSAGKAAAAGDEVTDSFAGMAKKAIPAAAGIFSVLKLLKSMGQAVSDSGKLEFQAFNAMAPVEGLDALGRATEKVGGSREAAIASASAIQDDINMMAAGIKDVGEKYAIFGIQLDTINGKKRDSFDVLAEIAKKMEGVNKEAAMGMGKALGLDPGTIRLLMQGEAAYLKMIEAQKQLGVATKEDAEASRELLKAWSEVGDVIDEIIRDMSTASTPTLTKGLEKLKALLIDINELGGEVREILSPVFDMSMDDALKASGASDAAEFISDAASGVVNVVSNYFGGSGETNPNGAMAGDDISKYTAAQQSPFNQPVNQSTSSKSVSVQNDISIRIDAGSNADPKAIADEVEKKVKSMQVDSITTNFNDGIAK
ncbi:MAG: hypothetical protein GY779_16925 [Gammaproteobacteria bacterium]|nr:hypothetical protein [Gammaproteobacteria bacterium]